VLGEAGSGGDGDVQRFWTGSETKGTDWLGSGAEEAKTSKSSDVSHEAIIRRSQANLPRGGYGIRENSPNGQKSIKGGAIRISLKKGFIQRFDMRVPNAKGNEQNGVPKLNTCHAQIRTAATSMQRAGSASPDKEPRKNSLLRNSVGRTRRLREGQLSRAAALTINHFGHVKVEEELKKRHRRTILEQDSVQKEPGGG